MKKTNHKATDHTGKRYGRLVAIQICGKKIHSNNKTRNVWLCRCDCGDEVEVIGNYLTTRKTQSCGCLASDLTKERNKSKRKAIGDSAKLFAWNNYKNQALKRGHEWSFTLEQFVEICQRDCHYCGSPPEIQVKLGSYSRWTRNGIDRVDNSIGYTPENSVTCCFACNRMKSTLSVEVFIAKAKAIAKRFAL